MPMIEQQPAKRLSDADDLTFRKTKVVYTDVDNTLVGPGGSLFLGPDRRLSLEPARMLLGLEKAGIDVVLVSGRNNAQLREISRLLGLSNYIAELGCLTYYDNGREVVSNHDFPVGTETNLHQAIKASGAPALLLEHFSGRLEYHAPWASRQECTHLFRGNVSVDAANNLLNEAGMDALRLIDNGSTNARGNLQPLPEYHAYHLLPKNASKGAAIKADLEKRGLARAQAIALGDSLADLEMAEAVTAFFLVSERGSHDEAMIEAIGACKNVFTTTESMGLGWAEVAGLILNSQSSDDH